MIPFRQPFIDRLLQFSNTEEGTPSDHAIGNHAEPTLHLIQPRAAGRGEVQMEALSFLRLEPALHGLAFVGTVVIQDEMELQIRRDLLLQFF